MQDLLRFGIRNLWYYILSLSLRETLCRDRLTAFRGMVRTISVLVISLYKLRIHHYKIVYYTLAGGEQLK